MAFKGDLKNISLFDVFQTLNTNQQTGVLVLQREGITKKVFISPEGVRIFFTKSFRAFRLGEVFVARGLISPQDVEILLLQQKQEYRPMGELLVESGKVSQPEVDDILRYHAEDEIYELFAWDSGHFAFYDGHSAGEHADTPLSDVLLDPAGLCLEAARRLDEIEKLRDRIPNNREYYARVDGIEPDPERNDLETCSVFRALAMPQSVDDLRDVVGLSLYDILRTLALLLDGGLIRPLTLDELLETGRVARDTGNHERAAQLLQKALQIDPANRVVLEECIESLQRLDDSAGLADLLAALGRTCLADGEIDRAIDNLELALRHDADNLEALMALRDAFAAREDVERAAEISLKIARAQAERNELAEGVDACHAGLRLTPDSIPLRYLLGQLLVRVDRAREAQDELYAIVKDLDGDRKTLRNRKAHELLVSCYRLLLKIDPHDEDAQQGMRDLNRRRMSTVRRRKLAIQGAVAAGVLALAAVIALTIRGPGPAEMLERVFQAQLDNNPPAVTEAVDALLAKYPESPEAVQALAIRAELNKESTRASEERRGREKQLRDELQKQFDELHAVLKEEDAVEGLHDLKRFLDRLKSPEAAFLRRSMAVHVEHALSEFLDRTSRELEEDRGVVSAAGRHLKTDPERKVLVDLEERLGVVRRRNWPQRAQEMQRVFADIGRSEYIGKTGPAIDDFRKKIALADAAFASVDLLYYTVRRERLRNDIGDAADEARDRGRDLLTQCEFRAAYALYEKAYTMADAITDESEREYFRELLTWIDQRRIREKMKERMDEIESIEASLEQVRQLREADQPDAAFLILRDLITNHRIVQFERILKVPYRIESTPPGAQVLVNGEAMGPTPVAIEMEITEPTVVRVERDGFEGQETRLLPTDPKLTGRLEVGLTKRAEWRNDVAGLVEARPVVAGDLLLVATNNTSVLAFRIADGKFQWEAKSRLVERIQSAPAVANGKVYFVTGSGRLHEVDLATRRMNPATRQLPGLVQQDIVSDGRLVYVATQDRKLLALVGMEVLYEKDLAFTPSTGLLHSGGILYVGTADGAILAHEAKSGEEIARYANPSGSSFFGGVAVHGNLVMAGAEDGALYAFDTQTGKQAWRFPTTGPLTAAPASDGERIYVPARDGYVHVLGPDGEEVAAYDVTRAAGGTPVLAGGFLYAHGSRVLAAFDAVSGATWWNYTFPDEEVRYLCVGKGRLLAVTSGPRVVAFPLDEK